MKNFSWSLDLEDEEYVTDKNRLLQDAKSAVEITAPGKHVNLVTPASHGEPVQLIQQLKKEYGNKIKAEYVDQCGCGGYVTKVTVIKE
jgi:putative CGCGG family rSAM target protein